MAIKETARDEEIKKIIADIKDIVIVLTDPKKWEKTRREKNSYETSC